MNHRPWLKRWGVVALVVIALPLIPWTTYHLSSQRAHAQLGGGYRLSALGYLRKVIFLVNKHYVDRNQIDAAKMFRAALKRIQTSVPAVMVRFSKNKRSVDVYVDRKKKTFQLKPFPIIFSVPFQLRPILSFIERNYKGEVAMREIEFFAIHGILSTLDPHTGFLPPSYYKDMQLHTDGKFGGLGIVIQNKDGFLTVLTPMPGTPASRAGIQPMDRIVRIGDESTINMSLNEAVNKLRGQAGTKVVIWIQRKGFQRPKKVVIIRAVIKVTSVTSHLLKKKIAYVKVKHFQKDTAKEIRKALRKYRAKTKGLKGLVLDLRLNPGGLLNQAIAVSDIFLRRGTIVSHTGGSSPSESHHAHSLGTEPNYPIVVLVNRGSASASEIVAGALKNHNRALILGQQTHGKGTVQVLFPIRPSRFFPPERSALKLTIAQYLTPGGISIQEIGITPDIAIQAVHITKDLVHFFDSVEGRKAKKKLPRFLKGVREMRKPLYRLSYLDARSDKERLEQYREVYVQKKKIKLDFEISLAHQLLTKTKKWQRKQFFQTAKKQLNQIRRKEGKKIHKALRKAGVDWRKGNSPKNGKLKVSFRLLPLKAKKAKKGKKAKKYKAPQGNKVWAGSGFRLQVRVTNRSSKTAYRVRAMSLSKLWFFNRKEFAFGRILPKQTRRWTTSFEIPKWVKPQAHKLKLEFQTSNKRFKKTHGTFLKIQGFKRPRFDFSYALEEVKGNGDALIQPGESFALRVSVRNQGPGKARKVVGLLKNKTGRELFIKTGRIQFGAIAKGKHGSGWFYFNVKRSSTRKKIKVELSIFDTQLHTTTRRKLSLRVYPMQLKKQKIKGRTLQVKERWAWVYAGAALDAPRVARAKKGSTLAITGRLGPFYEISLRGKAWGSIHKRTPKRHRPQWRGWILARDTKLMAKAKKASAKVRLYWQSVTPQIALKKANKAILTHKPIFKLKGTIRNNVSLLDAYIMVNGEKVFYRALRNVPTIELSLPIKLKKGKNQILVVARESVQFSGYRELFVYYHPKKSK